MFVIRAVCVYKYESYPLACESSTKGNAHAYFRWFHSLFQYGLTMKAQLQLFFPLHVPEEFQTFLFSVDELKICTLSTFCGAYCNLMGIAYEGYE